MSSTPTTPRPSMQMPLFLRVTPVPSSTCNGTPLTNVFLLPVLMMVRPNSGLSTKLMVLIRLALDQNAIWRLKRTRVNALVSSGTRQPLNSSLLTPSTRQSRFGISMRTDATSPSLLSLTSRTTLPPSVGLLAERCSVL